MNTPEFQATPNAAALIAQLETQRGLIAELGVLTKQQSALVEDGQTASLLEVLAARQAIIERFAEGQRRLGEIAAVVEAAFAEVADDDRTRIRDLLQDIETNLAIVMKADAVDQQRLETNLAATRTELNSVDTGRAAQHAYSTHRPDGARFADRTG